MDRSQGSQSASRCFVYTATTFHVYTVCVPCVFLFRFWSIVMEPSILFLNTLGRQQAPISQSSQLHGSISGLSECKSLVRFHSDHLSCISFTSCSIVMELSNSEFIGQAANTYISQSQLHGSIPGPSECKSQICNLLATTFQPYYT